MSDDAPALQKRLARSNAVVTLGGAYRAATPIVLSGVRGLTVMAYGASITADPSQTNQTSQGDTLRLVDCHGVTILGLGFDGNRKARGGFGTNPETVRLNGCTDITFRDCAFTGDVCDAIFAWTGQVPAPAGAAPCQRLKVDACRFADPGRNCISLVGAAWCSITNNDFEGPGGDPGVAVDIEANAGDPEGINHHITIANNRVRNLKGAFWVIKTCAPSGVVVVGNLIDGIGGDAIFNEGLGTLIVGNNVTNCAKAGISCPKPGTMALFGNSASVYEEK